MDPDKVAQIAVAGMNFAWQGQSCGSTSRLLLHESLYKGVLERVVERVAALRLGDPLDDKSQMGPINSKRHYERVCAMVESGRQEGARLMTGGKRPAGEEFKRGYWLEPTVFADVNPSMRIAREEIFGPVLSVFSWRDEKEALTLANSTEYGLTASIFTNDLDAAFRAARAVKSGYVWINGASAFYGTPFGGYKNSGARNRQLSAPETRPSIIDAGGGAASTGARGGQPTLQRCRAARSTRQSCRGRRLRSAPRMLAVARGVTLYTDAVCAPMPAVL